MNFDDLVRTGFAIPLGGLAGTVAALLAGLDANQSWLVGTFLFTAIVLFAWLDRVADNLGLRAAQWFCDRSRADRPATPSERLASRHSPVPRYVFLSGLAIGFLASQIWSPLALVSWIALPLV